MSSRRQRSSPLGGRYRQVSLYDCCTANEVTLSDGVYLFIIQVFMYSQAIPIYIYIYIAYISSSNIWPHCEPGGMYIHCNDVIMGAIASQITSFATVSSTVDSDADQRKHQSSASLANSPHKWPVTRKMFPFGDVIMRWAHGYIGWGRGNN